MDFNLGRNNTSKDTGGFKLNFLKHMKRRLSEHNSADEFRYKEYV